MWRRELFATCCLLLLRALGIVLHRCSFSGIHPFCNIPSLPPITFHDYTPLYRYLYMYVKLITHHFMLMVQETCVNYRVWTTCWCSDCPIDIIFHWSLRNSVFPFHPLGSQDIKSRAILPSDIKCLSLRLDYFHQSHRRLPLSPKLHYHRVL
jgi:hypothetical protein